MPAVLRETGDHFVADFFGQLLQLIQRELFHLHRVVHHIQISAHVRDWSDGVMECWRMGVVDSTLHHSNPPSLFLLSFPLCFPAAGRFSASLPPPRSSP